MTKEFRVAYGFGHDLAPRPDEGFQDQLRYVPDDRDPIPGDTVDPHWLAVGDDPFDDGLPVIRYDR